MSKELKDMTFDDLIRFGVEIDVDNIIQGKALKSRIYQVMELAARWSNEQNEKKNKNKS